VPVVVVFTKYDKLVTSEILGLDDEILEQLNDTQTWLHGEQMADVAFDKLCVRPLKEIVGEVPIVKVSSKFRGASN
jgi:hypothetical protein